MHDERGIAHFQVKSYISDIISRDISGLENVEVNSFSSPRYRTWGHSAYGWLFIENIGQPVKYINEIQNKSLPDNIVPGVKMGKIE